MRSNVIKQAFASTMKDAGFQKRGDGWYRETPDSILVANLQKSNFGEQYYVNLAVWLKALGEVRFPKEYQCHVRTRATALAQEEQKYWDEVFNLDHRQILEPERAARIKAFLEQTAIPFLVAAGSLAELRRLHREGYLKAAAVMARAMPVLQQGTITD